MIQFQINLNTGLPIYRQLMDQLRFYIASGAIHPGEQLPSIRAMAKQLAVNPTTIVKAYNELAHAGVIELRQGRGAFALASAQPEGRSMELLTPLAEQLAREAHAAGISLDEVSELLTEEYQKMSKEETGDKE